MKKILIIFLIILFPFYSFGKSIVGKGLVCENFQKGFMFTPIIGFWFDKGKVVSLFQQTNQGWFDGIKGKYMEKDFSISIVIEQPNIYMGNFSIDRNSGKLKHISFEFECDEIWNNKVNLKLGLNKRLESLLDKKREEKRKKEKNYQEKLNKRKF